MPSIGTLGSTLPLGPKSFKVKCQTFPHDGSTGLKSPAPDSPPITDNHHGAGTKGATGCGRYIREYLGWHGATYSVLTSYSRAFSSQNCTIMGATEKKQSQKYSPKHFFVAGMDKYFPTSFWWSLCLPYSLFEEIFPCLWNLADIAVLIEDALKLSFGSKLFLPATKWNNSCTGEAIYGCVIKESSDIK